MQPDLIGGGINRTFLFSLINAYVIVSIILLYVIVRQSIKLLLERRKKVPGSAFKRNLLLAFIIFSVIPSVIVFFIAGKFITTSIDNWFDARLGAGLNNGLHLHEQQTQQERKKIIELGNRIKAGLQKLPEKFELIEAAGDEVRVWRKFRKHNDRSTKSLRQDFFAKLDHFSRTETPFDFYGSLYWATRVGDRQLILAYRYPPAIRYPLIEMQNSIGDYAQLKSIKSPIYWSYLVMFLLLTLLILFLSIWCAFYLARGISEPIKELLLAIRKIRTGNFDAQVTLRPSDDLRALILGFNEMTRSLKQAYTNLAFHNKEMLTMLHHIKESVFFINDYGRIVSFNEASKKLVKQYLGVTRFKNKKISILGPYVKELFFTLVRELRKLGDQNSLSREITFSHEGELKTFMVYVTVMTSRRGVLVIVEDMSDLYKINKIKTWQEAAKQMAHEIKNPLTPIQLTTQRLQRKLRKQKDCDPALMACTQTILQQVTVIKGLVTHFSEFAKMPGTIIEQLDINKIIAKVGSMYQMSYPDIDFTYDLQKFLPTFKADKKKMKRVLVNLLDNSVRVLKDFDDEKKITIKTRFRTARNQIELLIGDSGPGISREVREKLFLPYVSSDKKNMGLGLAIAHDIVAQAGGSIKLLPAPQGAIFQILLPV